MSHFMNLATARSIGALRTALIVQFLIESLLTVAISLPLAIGLSYLALPAWQSFLNYPVALDLTHIRVLLSLIGIAISVGVLASAYPAMYPSAFDTARSLRGSTSVAGGAFRKPLVVVQFALAVVLVLGTFVATRQLGYVQAKTSGSTGRTFSPYGSSTTTVG